MAVGLAAHLAADDRGGRRVEDRGGLWEMLGSKRWLGGRPAAEEDASQPTA